MFPGRCIKTNDPVEEIDFKAIVDLFPNQVLAPKSQSPKTLEAILIALVGRRWAHITQLTHKQRLTFQIGLSRKHRATLRNRKLLSLAFFFLSILMPILMGVFFGIDHSVAMGIGMGLFALFLIAGILMFGIASLGAISVARSDGSFVWLNGAGQEFLDSLRESPVVWDGREFVDRVEG